MESEINKITLEVEGKAETSAKGIDTLVEELKSLDDALDITVPNLTKLNSGFTKLVQTSSALQSIDLSSINSGVRALGDAMQSVNASTLGFDTMGDRLRTMSSGLNSARRAFVSLNEAAPKLSGTNLTGLTDQLGSLDQIAKMSETFLKMKDGAKAFSTAVNNMDKAADKFPIMMGKINDLDLSKFKVQVDELADVMKVFNETISTTSTSVQGFAKVVNGLPTSVSKATSAVTKAQKSSGYMSTGGVFGLGGGVNLLSNIYMMRQVANAFGTAIQRSNDFIETMNLFNVVMGESTARADRFITALESIGVDQEQAMRFQASFYDIAKSLGLSTKNAYTLSEQFTKLSYDYASLYNLPIEESFQKLQAAAVGTTEPIRRLGKDISVAKLEEIALSLGIDESVRSMTQSEKATLRFIAVMQQSTSAMNDMERTINAPANSLRVLRAQFTALTRELGNLFIPMLSAVLPYLIAITKFIRGIVTDIASLLGIQIAAIDFDGVNTSLGISDDYTSGISDNLDDSANSAKKLKDNLMGIDELNVLNKDTGAGIDTGDLGLGISGGDLGLDLEDFGYQDVLKEVNSQADKILKTFEEWKPVLLGIAGILGTLWAVGKITKFISALKGVSAATGTLGWGVKGFMALGGVIKGLGVKVGALLGIMGPLTSGTAFALGLGTIAVALVGVGIAAYGVYEAMQPAIEQVNEFAYISEEVEEKLKPVIDVWKDLDKEITKLDWSNKVITDADVQSVVGKTQSMVDDVLAEVDADRNQALQDIELLQGVEGISEETYQKMIAETEEYYSGIQVSTEEAEARISEIMNQASQEKRELKAEEVEELKRLEQQIRDNAVNTMTESEEEQMMIMARLKHNQTALTVEAGSEMLTAARANADEQVAAAEEWRLRMLAELDKRFGEEADMGNKAYADQYNAIQQAYEEQVAAAEQGYIDINDEVKAGLGDQYRYIDEETGKIKSNWDMWLSDLGTSWNNFWGGLQTWWQEINDGLGSWWDGIEKGWVQWNKEFDQKWDAFWGGLGTMYNNVTKGLSNWWNTIKSTFNSWKQSFQNAWDNFWGGLGTWWDNSGLNPGNWGGRSRMSVGVNYVAGPMPAMKTLAFAQGGFVPPNMPFVSPSAWTAGEAGKELVGSYQGHTTVMPLENTSFVSSMHDAVYRAVSEALDTDDDGTPIVVLIGEDAVTKTAVKGINRLTKKNGKSPLIL